MKIDKKPEQEGILAYSENSIRVRVCPNCKGKLRIDTSNFKVYCSCGYVEPCHLRSLTIGQTNCSSCPYSPNYREAKEISKAKAEYFKRFRTKRGVLPLGAVKALVQENLDYPKLKSKCYQAWNPMKNEGRVFLNRNA
jgi:hypothetical protein